MSTLKEYLLQPTTIYKIIVWIFFLWMVWTNLNTSVAECKDRITKIEALDLNSRLASIETKLDLIMVNLDIKFK